MDHQFFDKGDKGDTSNLKDSEFQSVWFACLDFAVLSFLLSFVIWSSLLSFLLSSQHKLHLSSSEFQKLYPRCLWQSV